MRRRLFSFVFILLFSLSGLAQKPSDLEQNLRAHVEYLASDKLEGRRTGEKGATAAAEYIAKAFAKIKLKPGVGRGNGKSSFLQAFPYVTGVEAAPTGNDFRLRLSKERSEWVKTVLAKPVGFSPNANVPDTPVVYAGFGIVSPDLKHDDYANLDAKGKIVLVFDGNPENDNPHSMFGKFDVRTKALIARDKGAVGMLVISREEDFHEDKLTRMTFDQTLGEAALPTFVISRTTAANILDVIEKDLKTIGLANVKSDTRAIVGFKVNLIKKTSQVYNPIGVLPGTDSILKNEAIVIGAHYDHLGRGGQGSLDVNSSKIHHGADDNASGTAAILELARQFAGERKNKRTIIFIAFSGEEEGLLGSKYYVNNPIWPLDKTVAMINLDMVGRLKDEKLTVGGIGTASEWKGLVNKFNWVTRTIASSTYTFGTGATKSEVLGSTPSTVFELQLNEDGFGPSDHSSFYGKKIPVLFFFTGTHVDYHKPSDTFEKINYHGLTKITSYVGEIVRSVDQYPTRPTYAVAKSSGVIGGRTGFKISLGTIPSYADSTDGLVLDGVRENSPAAKAGLKVGDKIIKLAGKDVRNAMDYTYVLGEMKAGEEYEIVVIRGGERLTLKIIPVKR